MEAWQLIAEKALRDYEAGRGNPDRYWWSMTIDRDDVVQAAMMRAWKAWDKSIDHSSLVRDRNTYFAARYGIRNYLHEYLEQAGKIPGLSDAIDALRGDGIDPEHCPERVSLDDITVVEQLQAEAADAEVLRKERQSELRGKLILAAKACLTPRQRRILFLRYGVGYTREHLPQDIMYMIRMSKSLIYAELADAEMKMKAELQASGILDDYFETIPRSVQESARAQRQARECDGLGSGAGVSGLGADLVGDPGIGAWFAATAEAGYPGEDSCGAATHDARTSECADAKCCGANPADDFERNVE